MAFRKSNAVTFVAEEDLFLARDQRTIVRAGDKRAIFLLARKGLEVPAAAVKALGITEKTEPEPLDGTAAPVAPAEIETRATRPEKPTRTR